MNGVLMILGYFVFILQTVPYQSLQQNIGWNHPSNSRVGRRPAYQYIGRDEETLTLSGAMYPQLTGGKIMFDLLRDMGNTGEPYYLIDGSGTIYGQFVIVRISIEQTYFFADGTARKIEFTIELIRIDEEDILSLASIGPIMPPIKLEPPPPPQQQSTGAYIEIFTKQYPYWTAGDPWLPNQEQGYYNDGGQLRGKLVNTSTSGVMTATLEPRVMGTNFDAGGLLDKRINWNGPSLPSHDVLGGPFYEFVRPEGGSGTVTTTLTQEVINQYLSYRVDYEINLLGVDLTYLINDMTTAPTNDNDVVAILFSAVTESAGGVEVSESGRAGLWLFGVIGPGKAVGNGVYIKQWDQNNPGNLTIIKNGNLDFKIIGTWNIVDSQFSDSGGNISAKNINEWASLFGASE